MGLASSSLYQWVSQSHFSLVIFKQGKAVRPQNTLQIGHLYLCFMPVISFWNFYEGDLSISRHNCCLCMQLQPLIYVQYTVVLSRPNLKYLWVSSPGKSSWTACRTQVHRAISSSTCCQSYSSKPRTKKGFSLHEYTVYENHYRQKIPIITEERLNNKQHAESYWTILMLTEKKVFS
jgi:hypothetical protein